ALPPGPSRSSRQPRPVRESRLSGAAGASTDIRRRGTHLLSILTCRGQRSRGMAGTPVADARTAAVLAQGSWRRSAADTEVGSGCSALVLSSRCPPHIVRPECIEGCGRGIIGQLLSLLLEFLEPT